MFSSLLSSALLAALALFVYKPPTTGFFGCSVEGLLTPVVFVVAVFFPYAVDFGSGLGETPLAEPGGALAL